MTTTQKVYEYLEQKSIPYSVNTHPPVFTIEDMEKLELDKIGSIVKNLFLCDSSGKRHFLVLMCGDKRVNLKEFQAKIGSSKLRFASEARLENHLGLATGAVSPFGLLNDMEKTVEVVIDSDLDAERLLGVHPNDNTATVWLERKHLESFIEQQGNSILYITV